FRPATLRELAQRYVAEIRAIEPNGPYHLLGWSLGGVLAHEIARELQQSGAQVERLVMVDSFVERARTRTEDVRAISASDLLGGIGIAQHDEPGEDAPPVTAVATAVARQYDVPTDVAEDVVRALVDNAARDIALLAEHRPGVFDGDVRFLTAGADNPSGDAAATGWRRYVTGTVHNRVVPATHWQMTTPDVLPTVAAELSGAKTA
ncbi:MAG: hypothetical protein ICV72_12850, partial [Aldersonia sp.]|nr:hypothetical protein [Aldersonia sp.]